MYTENRTKHLCPRCGSSKFITTAHVVQSWFVDEHGSFEGASSDCDEVDVFPDPGNTWTCAVCGAEGVIVDESVSAFSVPEALKGMPVADVTVSLWRQNFKPSYISEPVSRLYDFWKTRSDICPEDDEVLENIVISTPDHPQLFYPYSGAISFKGLMEACARAWPELPRKYADKSKLYELHEAYVRLTDIQAILESASEGQTKERQLSLVYEEQYLRYMLSTNGFDPDLEPEELQNIK